MKKPFKLLRKKKSFSAQKASAAKTIVETIVETARFMRKIGLIDEEEFQKFIISKTQKNEPNIETLEAMKEIEKGSYTRYKTVDDFWKDMGMKNDR